jgi:hypothetical protein
LASVEFVKEMMEQNNPECPYEYVPGKEFLPDFVIVGNKRLLHMRVFQMWYLEAVELGLGSVPVSCPTNDIFATGIDYPVVHVSSVFLNSSLNLVLCACAILLTTHLPYFHVGKSGWICPS